MLLLTPFTRYVTSLPLKQFSVSANAIQMGTEFHALTTLLVKVTFRVTAIGLADLPLSLILS